MVFGISCAVKKAIEVVADEAVSLRHQRAGRTVIEGKVWEGHANSSERTANEEVYCNRIANMSSYSPLQLGGIVAYTVNVYLASTSECPHYFVFLNALTDVEDSHAPYG